jgi:hypothetical protein
MKTSFLIETYSPDQTQTVTESVLDESTGKRSWYLNGICMMGDAENRNKRRYPVQEISKAVESLQESIKNKQCFGELDHPLDSRIAIELKNVSHMFESLTMDGTNAVGRIKILDTPMGTIASKILEGGGRLGVSSRGTGDVMEGGIVKNFQCSCIDLVATPSAQNAMPESIYEALQQDIQGRRVQTLAEALQEDKSAQKYFDIEVKKFIRSLLG